jgi:hypothetical protein
MTDLVGSAARDPVHPSGSAMRASSALFVLLWTALSDVLGTAATATLLRRACKRAAVRAPVLEELFIVKTDLVYTFETPAAWNNDGDEPPDGLRALLVELRPLLTELTGPVLVRRLDSLTLFQERGLVAPQGGPK